MGWSGSSPGKLRCEWVQWGLAGWFALGLHKCNMEFDGTVPTLAVESVSQRQFHERKRKIGQEIGRV